MLEKPKARSKNVVIQRAMGELIVYDTETNNAVCLNETSSMVWNLCDGKRTVREIRSEIKNKLGEPVSIEFVNFAIDQLKRENLFENGNELGTFFEGLSRREVIKKVGVSALVTLPIVASLSAPKAIHAQSCLATGVRVPGSAGPAAMDCCQNAMASALAQCCAMATTNDGSCTASFDPMALTCDIACQ